MTHREQIEWYRRMTPREKFRLMGELMDMGWNALRRQGPEQVALAIKTIHRRHQESSEALRKGLSEAWRRHDKTSV